MNKFKKLLLSLLAVFALNSNAFEIGDVYVGLGFVNNDREVYHKDDAITRKFNPSEDSNSFQFFGGIREANNLIGLEVSYYAFEELASASDNKMDITVLYFQHLYTEGIFKVELLGGMGVSRIKFDMLANNPAPKLMLGIQAKVHEKISLRLAHEYIHEIRTEFSIIDMQLTSFNIIYHI
jgi:hypothetical protein